jgi:hypothetical protein
MRQQTFPARAGSARILLMAALAAMCSAAPVKAQTAPPPSPPVVAPPAAPAKVILAIVSASCDPGSPPDRQAPCRLGDVLTVRFANLAEWMAASPETNKPADLALVLNNRVLKGVRPRGPHSGGAALDFDLSRLTSDEPDGKENHTAWDSLLSQARRQQTMALSLAPGGNQPYLAPVNLEFRAFPAWSGLVWTFLGVLLVVFVLLARRSDLLRDRGYAPAAGERRSFSLARCQMAWWFFVVLAGYLYIWMVVGDHESLTAGVLILIGISSATGFSSVMVDSSKQAQRQTLTRERDAVKASVAELRASLAASLLPADRTELQAELIQQNTRLAQIAASVSGLPAAPGASEGFWIDILNDGGGVSFHRFQMAAWTIVLGAVFAVSVYQSLAMPDFSATLLGLMGISAGAYIGFKIPDSPK